MELEFEDQLPPETLDDVMNNIWYEHSMTQLAEFGFTPGEDIEEFCQMMGLPYPWN